MGPAQPEVIHVSACTCNQRICACALRAARRAPSAQCPPAARVALGLDAACMPRVCTHSVFNASRSRAKRFGMVSFEG
eukprot:8185160-Alexandrium_andersonii.AAC.1